MPRLFDPLTLAGLTLSNRIVVSPMCQYSAVDGLVQPWHTVHLGQLAMGDPGLILLEATAVEPIGRITAGCLGLYDGATEEAMARLVAELRSLNPNARTPIGLQLGHAGRKGSSHLPWEGGRQIPLADGGWTCVAPSALAHQDGEEAPLALAEAGLEALTSRYVEATKRAARVGFDAVELHAAHGYLLHQFLSPVANRREDRWGGTLDNRMRFPLAVLAAVRDAWPEGRPLGIRLSATDWDEASSWTLDEALVFAERCEALGVDWIDVSSGGVSRAQKIRTGPGYQVPFAEAIKARVGPAVMAVGSITEPAQAEQILVNGQADLVALARAFLYDPRWVWHAARELGASVSVPCPYWRSEPAEARGLYGQTRIGMR